MNTAQPPVMPPSHTPGTPFSGQRMGGPNSLPTFILNALQNMHAPGGPQRNPALPPQAMLGTPSQGFMPPQAQGMPQGDGGLPQQGMPPQGIQAFLSHFGGGGAPQAGMPTPQAGMPTPQAGSLPPQAMNGIAQALMGGARPGGQLGGR